MLVGAEPGRDRLTWQRPVGRGNAIGSVGTHPTRVTEHAVASNDQSLTHVAVARLLMQTSSYLRAW